MKKYILSILLGTSLLTSVPAYAAQSDNTVVNNETVSTARIEDEGTVRPYLMVSLPKTVTKLYSSFSSIPDSIPYEEYYHNTWCSGDLYLQSVVKEGSLYRATFAGTIFGVVS
ncbi:MAG: hypothetical protein ACK5JH_17225 [Anaerocolumna sp.]